MYIGPVVETDYGTMGCSTLDCCRAILGLDLVVALQLNVEAFLHI